jgi:catechol 2,3-dioxygenase-like lactoylglutathione lyase family enzyme
MYCDLHHVHLFASNLDESIGFYRKMFKAEILFDEIVAGVRNVMIRIGIGLINFYDQPPRDTGKSAVHHLGIQTDDISALAAHMGAQGFNFRSPVRDFGDLKYIMIEGPDRVLIEIFESRQLMRQNM